MLSLQSITSQLSILLLNCLYQSLNCLYYFLIIYQQISQFRNSPILIETHYVEPITGNIYRFRERPEYGWLYLENFDTREQELELKENLKTRVLNYYEFQRLVGYVRNFFNQHQNSLPLFDMDCLMSIVGFPFLFLDKNSEDPTISECVNKLINQFNHIKKAFLYSAIPLFEYKTFGVEYRDIWNSFYNEYLRIIEYIQHENELDSTSLLTQTPIRIKESTTERVQYGRFVIEGHTFGFGRPKQDLNYVDLIKCNTRVLNEIIGLHFNRVQMEGGQHTDFTRFAEKFMRNGDADNKIIYPLANNEIKEKIAILLSDTASYIGKHQGLILVRRAVDNSKSMFLCFEELKCLYGNPDLIHWTHRRREQAEIDKLQLLSKQQQQQQLLSEEEIQESQSLSIQESQEESNGYYKDVYLREIYAQYSQDKDAPLLHVSEFEDEYDNQQLNNQEANLKRENLTIQNLRIEVYRTI